MRTVNKIALVILVLLFSSRQGYSQQKAAYIPEHGFWQLVNEKDQKGVTTVQFYTDNSELIYQENMKGIKFNMKKAKTFRWLKEGLDRATVAWNERRKAIYDQGWMASIVKR
ncbi:MAG TPA: hypothetical protein VK563_04060 [Puia sp.]|nr:hypothetical protein [Puia sp.]